jgi:N-acetylmuramoyl-L-alanine amidase
MANQNSLFIFLLIIAFAGFSSCDFPESEEPRAEDSIAPIVLFENGNPVSVEIPVASGLSRHQSLSQIARAMVEGVEGNTARPPLPTGSHLLNVDTNQSPPGYHIVIPSDFLSKPLKRELADRITSQFINSLSPLGETGARIFLGFSAESMRPMETWIEKLPPVPAKPDEDSGKAGPAHPGTPQVTGSLTGKSIFLSQSHGWFYNNPDWLTQRPNTNGIVEDFINAEAINQYLVNYLWNSGASAWTCRERDMNINQVIIDDLDSGFATTGSWTAGAATPDYWGSGYQFAQVSATESAGSTWTPDFPEDGYYQIYVWYTGGANRSTDARFVVRHPAGQTVVLVNQQRDAYTFRHLGRFYFYAGSDLATGSVKLSNQGSDPSKVVIADAVRFGGGMGSIDPGGGTSGKPRWEESGRYFSEFMGCPSCNTGTVSAMPRYAKWESEAWEDSLYISWHTNAPNPGTGTSSFVYSSAGWGGAFNGVSGSQELQNFVHAELINDIRAGYDATWVDRGQNTADFGEVNPYYNDEMPALLFELAFHDTPYDAGALKDPNFRQLAARAVYQGIVKYFADRDGLAYTLLPEPPVELFAYEDQGDVIVEWLPGPADSGDGLYGDPTETYRIYTSPDGKDFVLYDEVSSKTTSFSLAKNSEPLYVRVSGVNQGGESLPSEVLAAAEGITPNIRVLLVNGFDRLGAGQLIPQYESGPLGTDYRMFLDRMNSYDYVRPYAQALSALGISYDSASNEAAMDLDPASYDCVVWILGEESTTFESLSDQEQAYLAGYLDQGGSLLISGSEIGWDLDLLGSASDRLFYANYLRAELQADDSGTYGFEGIPGAIFDGVDGAYDDSTYGIYDVDYPDVLGEINGSSCAMEYDQGGCAGIIYEAGYKLVYLGFPIEAVYETGVRTGILNAAFSFLIDSPLPNELLFFREGESGSCRAVQWGLSESMNPLSFTLLHGEVENGSDAIAVTIEPIPADDLDLDRRYGYLDCESGTTGFYFLDALFIGNVIKRFGPAEKGPAL